MLDIAQREAVKQKKLFRCPFSGCIFTSKSEGGVIMHIENKPDHMTKVGFILRHFKRR